MKRRKNKGKKNIANTKKLHFGNVSLKYARDWRTTNGKVKRRVILKEMKIEKSGILRGVVSNVND